MSLTKLINTGIKINEITTEKLNISSEFVFDKIQANTITVRDDLYSNVVNVIFESVNSVSSYANSAFNTANNSTDSWVRDAANSASSYANSAFETANNAVDTWVRDAANSASSYANSAFGVANTATDNSSTASSYANSAFSKANTATDNSLAAGSYANSAFNTANTADDKAETSGDYANSAFEIANSSVKVGDQNTFTNKQIFLADNDTLSIKVDNFLEKSTIVASPATGTINFDLGVQSVLFYTTNATGNWVLNFRTSSSETLNSQMDTGDVVTATFLSNQGATSYYNTSITIDNNAQSVKWLSANTPTDGIPDYTNVYTYSIIKTGSSTYTVLGSQSYFG